jgi:hypothetical protein
MQLEFARVDGTYLEHLATVIDEVRHDSHFKLFYPIYFIVQQVRHAASFDHVCLKSTWIFFLFERPAYVETSKLSRASYLELIVFPTLAIFISIGVKGQKRGEAIGAFTASFFQVFSERYCSSQYFIVHRPYQADSTTLGK